MAIRSDVDRIGARHDRRVPALVVVLWRKLSLVLPFTLTSVNLGSDPAVACEFLCNVDDTTERG